MVFSMTFKKYMHVERYTESTNEVRGILNGTVYIYPKLDGSNHCIWYDTEKGEVRCASRNQVLSTDYDSTHFVNVYYLSHKTVLDKLATENKDLIFYGEFMRPHVIRNYLGKVWDDWYVFDVYDTNKNAWLSYDEYRPILEKYGVSYITPIAVIDNPTLDFINECVVNNNYLMEDGFIGEGVVIKNYGYSNIFGRTTWAKIVRDEFKVAYRASPKDTSASYESKLVEQYLNPDFIEKEYYKFVDEKGTWDDRMIPDVIQQVIAEWWKDYSYEVIAMSKKPIDVSNLRKHMSKKIVGTIFRIRK